MPEVDTDTLVGSALGVQTLLIASADGLANLRRELLAGAAVDAVAEVMGRIESRVRDAIDANDAILANLLGDGDAG